jgi:hypothetical protein
MITQHAAQRAFERAGITNPAELYRLWELGRKVDDSEIAAFNTRPAFDVTYRIVIWRGCCWLLARGSTTGAFITILRKA